MSGSHLLTTTTTKMKCIRLYFYSTRMKKKEKNFLLIVSQGDISSCLSFRETPDMALEM